MVSIIITQAYEREKKIKTIENALKEHPDVDIKKLILEVAGAFKCSERKAKEYVRMASFRRASDGK